LQFTKNNGKVLGDLIISVTSGRLRVHMAWEVVQNVGAGVDKYILQT